MAKGQSVEERFWGKVRKGPKCWLWTGGTSGDDGYGVFWINGRSESAHRMAWILTRGEIPDGLFVLHSCDVKPCVRHLFLGTQKDNRVDCAKKGRTARGSRNGARLYPERLARGESVTTSKLTEEIVRAMRKARAEGVLLRELAARYKVSIPCVHRATTGGWAHVT